MISHDQLLTTLPKNQHSPNIAFPKGKESPNHQGGTVNFREGIMAMRMESLPGAQILAIAIRAAWNHWCQAFNLTNIL